MANVWPEEIPEFEPVLGGMYRKLENLGKVLLEVVGDALGLERSFFIEMVTEREKANAHLGRHGRRGVAARRSVCHGRGGQEVGGTGRVIVVVVLRLHRLIEIIRGQRKRPIATGRHRRGTLGRHLRSGRSGCVLPAE